MSAFCSGLNFQSRESTTRCSLHLTTVLLYSLFESPFLSKLCDNRTQGFCYRTLPISFQCDSSHDNILPTLSFPIHPTEFERTTRYDLLLKNLALQQKFFFNKSDCLKEKMCAPFRGAGCLGQVQVPWSQHFLVALCLKCFKLKHFCLPTVVRYKTEPNLQSFYQ